MTGLMFIFLIVTHIFKNFISYFYIILLLKIPGGGGLVIH